MSILYSPFNKCRTWTMQTKEKAKYVIPWNSRRSNDRRTTISTKACSICTVIFRDFLTPKRIINFCFSDTVNVFLLIYQLGTCCVYVVFIATNVKEILDQYIGETDVRLYMLVFLLPLILINWIRNLKYLAPFSTIANVITAISFGIIFYFIIGVHVPTFNGRETLGEIAHLPLFFGTVLFALEAIGVVSIA